MKTPLLITRRNFVKTTATTIATFTFLPRHLLAASGQTPPSEKLNIAAIGCGGRAVTNLDGLAPGNNIVALCDVDSERGAHSFKKFPQAKQYRDFRKMFDEMGKEIDAVMVATPDHTHAVAAMAAIERGKHLYCEKPLAHSIYEVRQLMNAARKHKVVTQLGNQGHSYDSIRDACEWIWSGAIGKVHTIHAGCNYVNSAIPLLASVREQIPVPSTLDWDLWLGPAQPRPYNPAYVPSKWRYWTPFGCGTIGDWCCHVVDPAFWALDLGAPVSIHASAKDYDPKTQGDTFPTGDIITFEFPANSKRGPITLHWYSGTEPIPRPPELDPGEDMIKVGAVVQGDKGTLMYGSHGARELRLIPKVKMEAFQRPPKTIPRVRDHYVDWLNAVRTGGKAGSDFSYGGPLTEIALLGVVALKMPGTKLAWDTQRTRFTNNSEANQYIHPPYRKGWTL